MFVRCYTVASSPLAHPVVSCPYHEQVDLIFADLLQVVETTCIKLLDKKS